MIAHNMIKMSTGKDELIKYLYDSIFKKEMHEKLAKKSANHLYDYSWFLLTYLQSINPNTQEKTDQGLKQLKDSSQENVYKKYLEMNLKSKWHSKPGSANDAKTHYDKERAFFIEKLVNEQQIVQELFKYPILSEKSVKECDETLLAHSKRMRMSARYNDAIF